jgi:antitoxin component HigA of HigAB toxin-antitoxin module
MKTAVRLKKVNVTDDYLALIHEFPLRELRNDCELDTAMKIVQRLMMQPEDSLSEGEGNYLGALATIVQSYESKRYPIERDRRTPLQRLKYVLKESGTTPSRLREILECSQSLVSMILSGNRELSKDNIARLAAHFKLNVAYFF